MSLCYDSALLVNRLLLADAIDLRAAASARTLGSRPTVLHFDRPWIADLYLFPTLHTIGLHFYLLFEFGTRLARTNKTVKRVAISLA